MSCELRCCDTGAGGGGGETPGAGAAPRTVLNASGYVTARREATVSAKAMGKVVEVLVEEGKRVEAGQVLARLDDSNLRANRDLAEAQLQTARVAVQETRALIMQARSNWERVRELVADKVATVSELEKAESDFKSLEARSRRQEAEILAAERGLLVWDRQLEDMVIRAPFSGVVTAKNAQPGEVISPMAAGGFTRTGICTLVDMDSLEIEVDVNESYLNRVSPGQGVEASLDAYPDWHIPAHVIAIIPTADRQKATVKVRVAFEHRDPRILPQMGVKVAFRGAEDAAAPAPAAATPGAGAARRLLLPRSAVQEAGGSQIVWVVREGRAERRAVRAQAAGSDGMEMLAGVIAGERVVAEPSPSLVDGVAVKERKP